MSYNGAGVIANTSAAQIFFYICISVEHKKKYIKCAGYTKKNREKQGRISKMFKGGGHCFRVAIIYIYPCIITNGVIINVTLIRKLYDNCPTG